MCDDCDGSILGKCCNTMVLQENYLKCLRGEIRKMAAMMECLVEEEIKLLYAVAMMCDRYHQRWTLLSHLQYSSETRARIGKFYLYVVDVLVIKCTSM